MCSLPCSVQQASLEEESRSAILILTILASTATMVAVWAQLSGLSKAKGFEAPAVQPVPFRPFWCPGFSCTLFLPSTMCMSFTAKRNETEAPEPALIFMIRKVLTISISCIYRW